MYEIQFKPAAQRQIKKLDKSTRKEIYSCLESLQNDPRHTGVEKLSHQENLYRVRTGDYRIIYQIQDASLVVLVVKIGHRREVYRF